MTFRAHTTISDGDMRYEGEDILVSNCTLTVQGAHHFASLVLMDSAVLRHEPSPGGDPAKAIHLTIQNDATVESGSRIDVSGLGYGAQAGPGAGGFGYYGASGACHGGPGGDAGAAGGPVYGSILRPTQFGSGGGGSGVSGAAGGAGGGSIRLRVEGALTVDGMLSANGLDGAGGGGRISLGYAENSFAGGVSALGGTGASGLKSGGAGSIYTKQSDHAYGTLRMDGTGRDHAMDTPFSSPEPFHLVISNATAFPAAPVLLGSLRIESNAILTHPAGGPGLEVAVLGDVTVEAGGAIRLDGKGFPGGSGPGAGREEYYEPSGAGHGGLGGHGSYEPGGAIYGSAVAPVELGSGGGRSGFTGAAGGADGGALRLTVGGTLRVDGDITASGGSGGSLSIAAAEPTGQGRILADGGGSVQTSGGGGGGGRIALVTKSSSFTGTLSASGGLTGGSMSGPGADGTIHTGGAFPDVVISQSPDGEIPRMISHLWLHFDRPIDPATFSATSLVITSSEGPIPAEGISLASEDGMNWRIGFPTQHANGSYSLSLGAGILDLLGEEITSGYSHSFQIRFVMPQLEMAKNGEEWLLRWPSMPGITYQIQSCTDLSGGIWQDEGEEVLGTGEMLSRSMPVDVVPRKFFRLQLMDE